MKILVVLLSVTLAGCALVPRRTKHESRVLEGRVTFEEPETLPPGAVVHLTLSDLSRGDAPDAIVARYRIRTDGKASLPFALKVDSIVEPGHRYGIGASVIDPRGRVVGTAGGLQPVSLAEPRSVEIAVRPVVEPVERRTAPWWEG